MLYAGKSNFSALLPWPERDRRWALSAGSRNSVLVTAVAVACRNSVSRNQKRAETDFWRSFGAETVAVAEIRPVTTLVWN